MNKWHYILLLLLSVVLACAKNGYSSHNDHIKALGHGGMGISSIYPLNSYESILYCLALGAEGTEIDVQMTKDHVLVAFHNLDLSERTNKSGLIHEQLYTDIAKATYDLPLYTEYELVNMDVLFGAIDIKESQTFFLDCKNYNSDTSAVYLNAYTDALIQLIDKYDLVDQVVVELKRRDLIEVLLTKRPDIQIFAFAAFEQAVEIAEDYDLPGFVISVEHISQEQVELAHEQGLEVAVYNANTRERNKKAIEIGANYIQTDKLKHLLDLLGAE